MRVLLPPTPKDSEVTLLQITSQEHDDLHDHAVKFINEKHVFSNPVKAAEIPAKAPKATGMAVIVHSPACTCKVSSCCE